MGNSSRKAVHVVARVKVALVRVILFLGKEGRRASALHTQFARKGGLAPIPEIALGPCGKAARDKSDGNGCERPPSE